MLFILTYNFFSGSTSYLIFENKFNFFHNLNKNNNNLIEIIFIQIIFIEISILISSLIFYKKIFKLIQIIISCDKLYIIHVF